MAGTGTLPGLHNLTKGMFDKPIDRQTCNRQLLLGAVILWLHKFRSLLAVIVVITVPIIGVIPVKAVQSQILRIPHQDTSQSTNRLMQPFWIFTLQPIVF